LLDATCTTFLASSKLSIKYFWASIELSNCVATIGAENSAPPSSI